MSTSHDNVLLTPEEQRVLALLEEMPGRRDRHRMRLTLLVGAARLRSLRLRPVGVGLVMLLGAALTVSTFTRWPAVAVIGVVALMWAVWALTLLISDVATRVTRTPGGIDPDRPRTRPR